jgi:drug/metabolite transporter (DMT)-like permease
MSVNAPVVAAVSILAATVAGLWSGQGLTVLATGGLVLAIVAIFAVSQASAGTADQRRYAGLMEALGAGVGFGVFSISLSHTAGFGAIPSLLVVRATSALLLGAIALATLHQVSASRYVRAGSPIGVLELIGNMLLAVALSVGNLPIIQAVFSLNPVVTASLARIVYRERLTRMQMVGAFAAFLAIPLLALGGS